MVLLLALVAMGGFAMFGGDGKSISMPGSGDSDGDIQCDVASVSVTYNDRDEYQPGSDPGTANLYITTDSKGSQSEGAITLTPTKQYESLAGYASTAVFAERKDFATTCENQDLVVDVVKPGAPTVTVTNDNGVTENSDTNHESVDADSTYTATVTVKAPAKQCSSRHGAKVVLDYDKTYVSSAEILELGSTGSPDYLGHASLDNATGDGFSAFLFDGELCNGAKDEFTVSYETTSTSPTEGNANIVVHWLPINGDIDADTEQIIFDVEDEDNNALVLGNTTVQIHTA